MSAIARFISARRTIEFPTRDRAPRIMKMVSAGLGVGFVPELGFASASGSKSVVARAPALKELLSELR